MTDTTYSPFVKQVIGRESFPDIYIYINDTLCIGRAISVDDEFGFRQTPCFYNLETGKMQTFDTEDIRPAGMRAYMDASEKNNLIVEAGINCDVIMLYDFNGKCIHRILGPNFFNEVTKNKNYYNGVLIADDRIFVLYDGGQKFSGNEILVFDMDGNYLRTLKTGYEIVKMAFSPSQNRIYFTLNDADYQFAYVDIEKIEQN